MALSLTCCICCVLALNTLNSANAELQVQNGAVVESYGVGYTLKLNDVDCEVNGVQAVAHVAIKKDGVTLASSAEKHEYTFTEIGEYQLVYYTVLDGKYSNKAVDFSVENKPYFDFSKHHPSETAMHQDNLPDAGANDCAICRRNVFPPSADRQKRSR